uniref:hypothetical protein n=1 Tax=Halococcus agarilyticus TaxID=1232219 RepID=UPI0012AC3605
MVDSDRQPEERDSASTEQSKGTSRRSVLTRGAGGLAAMAFGGRASADTESSVASEAAGPSGTQQARETVPPNASASKIQKRIDRAHRKTDAHGYGIVDGEGRTYTIGESLVLRSNTVLQNMKIR